MAITYVGGTTGTGTGASYTVSLNGTLTGGSGTSPLAGDLIVVFAGHGNTAASAPTCSGNTSGTYVSTVIAVHSNDTWDTEFGVFHQWAGATPDTTLTIGRTNTTTYGGAVVVMVFRGVRGVASTPAALTASGTNGGAVNPPAITPTESGSWVVAGGTGMLSATDTAGMTAISNLTAVLSSYGNGSTSDASTIAGYYSGWTSGAFDPAAATGGNLANTSSSWAAATLVLLPEFAALSTNTDNFDANASLENSKWNISVDGTGTVTNTGGEAVLTPEQTNSFGALLYSDATSGGRYTLDSNGAYIKVTKRLKTANTAAGGYSIFRIYDWSKGLTNTYVEFQVRTDNSLVAVTCNAGTVTQTQTISTTWDADATPWLRISINSGTITWWTSAGGATPTSWTSRNTNTPPAAADLFKDALAWFQTFNDNWATTGALVDPFTIDGFNTSANAAGTNTTSTANPATYSLTPAASTDNIKSAASPATYSVTGVASTDGFTSAASPATYTLTGLAAISGFGYLSVANPASYSLTGVASTDNFTSVASPASYVMSGVAAISGFGYVSVANPATYSWSAFGTTDGFKSNAAPTTYSLTASPDAVNITSSANPAIYSLTAFAATSSQSAGLSSSANSATYSLTASAATSFVSVKSVANPATYSLTATAASAGRTYQSTAVPATYLMVPANTTDSTTGTEAASVIPVTVATQPAPISDQEFEEWLVNPGRLLVVLLEVNALDENGNVQRQFFSTKGYTSHPFDTVSNQSYLPFIKGGLDFQQSIALDYSGSLAEGDIELDNTEGDLDYLLGYSWQYQSAKAFIGDATWSRNNFRLIFDGTVEDLAVSARDVINVRLKDKLYRLDMPLHDLKIGGSGAESDRLLPVVFGECHNVTPVLLDEASLTYCYHAGRAEGAFEVRDNGIPVDRSPSNGSSPSTFQLLKKPFGRITCSVQGDAAIREDVTSGYQNTVVGIIYRLVTGWGTEPNKRFTDSDIDLDNFFQFAAENSQKIGVYITERMTVLQVAQEIAASIGARLTMSVQGKLRLVKIAVPPFGTPIEVGPSDMVFGSLAPKDRPVMVSSVKLGYCKNWTVQPDTAGGIPEEHKKMFAEEWLTVTVIQDDVRRNFELWSEPEQENTLLITKEDAGTECVRRVQLRSKQRLVLEMRCFADKIFTQVGDPVRLTHWRFGLGAGKTGQVISVAVDWIHAEVAMEVVV